MAESNATTEIVLFGALEIRHALAAPRRPPTQRVLALLGFLITHHSIPQGRDKLVELLWPELLPRQGRRMLSDTLWRTRKLLTAPGQADTPLLVLGGDAVTFRLDRSTTVDLLAFDEYLAVATEGELAPLRCAIGLYRGDFLEDCYDDWALYERERRREQYLSALLRLLAWDQAAGAHDAALQSALRLVQADPLREDGHRALMRLYYLLGRPSDALRAYESCRVVLEQELGVEPDPETLSLYEEILALQQRRAGEKLQAVDSTAAGPPILREVPLVGRQGARAEVMEAVEAALAGAGGLLLLSGEAGMGKSRLLREVASGASWRGAQVSWGRGREDAAALPFGALREALAAALSPLRARQLADLLPANSLHILSMLLPQIAELLPDVPLLAAHSGEYQIDNFHTAITNTLLALGQLGPQVLVLEDLQWFDPATLEALPSLAPALRDARVLLLLSARPDELAARPPVWQTLLRLDRTGLLRRLELGGLSVVEVADLVRRALRMRRAAPRFSARLAEASGGNPFFVLETLRALYEQGTLKRDASGGWHTPWDGAGSDYRELPLPQGLRQAIDGRLRELGEAARGALAAAAVLGQNFSPSVWASMTADTAGPWSSAVDQLLHRQFLVEDSAGYRFEHETLRELVYSDLDSSTRQSLHLRAAEALEHEHYARVEALAQHLYLAGAWGKAIPYLIQAGDRARAVCAYRDALRNYEQAQEAAAQAGMEGADPSAVWDIQLRRGAVATLLGEYPTAIAAYEEVSHIVTRAAAAPDASARTGGRRNAQIQALNGLIYVYGLRNEYANAHTIIQRAIALANESPRLLDRAEVCYQAGLISYRRDDYSEARRLLVEALKLYESLGLEIERAKCLLHVGFSYLRQNGPTDEVIDHLTQALEIYRKQGDRFAEHSCLVDIGSAYLLGGKLIQVMRAVEPCLSFFSSIGALDDVSACLFLRGEAYRRMGRLEEALDSLRESLAICTRLDRNGAALYNQVCIAATLRDIGHYDAALETLDQALQTDDRMTKARALLIATDIWRIKAQIDRAWIYLAEGFVLARWLGSKVYTGIAYRLLAQLRVADRDAQLPAVSSATPNSTASFDRSEQLLQEALCDDELALTLLAHGQYFAAQERYNEARDALTQAQTLMSRCGMDGALRITQQLFQALPAVPGTLRPGQRRVLLARRGVPRGRPLRPDELIEVIWTVEECDQYQPDQPVNKAVVRQNQLRRLCAEASAQGAEPTVSALAVALGVTARTIDRDIAALRAAGEQLATRGANG
jgi:DNA-binding SARP family transcriptional activator